MARKGNTDAAAAALAARMLESSQQVVKSVASVSRAHGKFTDALVERGAVLERELAAAIEEFQKSDHTHALADQLRGMAGAHEELMEALAAEGKLLTESMETAQSALQSFQSLVREMLALVERFIQRVHKAMLHSRRN